MKIQVKVNTIIMLVGPTECGKSTYATKVLIPQLQKKAADKNFIANIQYLSSDATRQEILGYPYDKYVQGMTESSQQAFDLLFTKLKAVTSFPVNAEFVIVDTTGLSEEFRKQVLDIAKENHYNIEAIVFDYKNVKDYYNSERSKKLIATHTDRLRRDVLPNLRKSDFREIHRIKAKDFFNTAEKVANPEYVVEVADYDEYLNHFLPNGYQYVMIGDIHEQIKELTLLLEQHGFTIENGMMQPSDRDKNKRFVLVGDWIDKGGYTREIVEFLYQNKEWFFLVKGNHENFVAKYLRGEIKEKEVESEVRENYFTSLPTLQSDEVLKNKFLELVDLSKDFYRFVGMETPSFYVTHAPCLKRYIGKIDPASRKNQRKFSTIHNEPLQEQLMFLQKDAVGNNPYHVFGHVAVKNSFAIRNKIGLDTGCVNGNKLTSVDLLRRRPFYKTIKSESVKDENICELPVVFEAKKSVKIEDLDEYDRKRLNYVLKNKVNFISGTMSPADKDVETDNLESLKQGLLYFKNSGVKEVVLQPKYMGSRCNVYLSQEIEECFGVSRNGYKIRHVDLTDVFTALQLRYKKFMDENNLKTLVLDGELLPWMALGKGLIEKEFQVVSKSLESEIKFLEDNGFENQFQSLVTKAENSGYNYDEVKSSKQDLIEKYGHAIYSTYKNVKEVLRTHHSVQDHKNALEVFQRQLEIYGQDTEMEFRAFSILKMIKNDGTEVLPTMKTSEMFTILSNDDFIKINLDDEASFEEAEKFFSKLTTERKMEGVVIKPEVMVKGIAPYMKVRNPDYLTIVYGYDYKFSHKKAKLMKQKGIAKKLRTSIAEYNLGQEMLAFNLESIEPANNDYKQVVANMLFETSKEKELDPRL
jgi:predicted kinase